MLIVNEDSVKSITLEKYLSPFGLEPAINTLKYQRKPLKHRKGDYLIKLVDKMGLEPNTTIKK